MASKNINGMVQAIRRVTNRSDNTSDSNFISENEIGLYIQDAAQDIRTLYGDFTAFTVSGVDITPAPDSIDERLLEWGAACLILMDDDIRSSGDAIFIKAGPISLDTSKSVRGVSESTKRLCDRFDNMLNSVIVNGKAGVASVGIRVDNYVENLDSVKDDRSLL